MELDTSFDVVVLGTGLIECILSALLSMEGKKVLHMDKNGYYGGACASLNLSQQFRQSEPPTPYGRDRDYNIDLIPKFIMAGGEFAKILAFTQVTRYLEFRQIEGSYVYRDDYVYRVPSTEMEAITSSLFGLFEKYKAKKFFEYMQNYDQKNPSTWQGMNMEVKTMAEVLEYFGLTDKGAQDFIGHALALNIDDSYLRRPAIESYHYIILYMTSMNLFGKSPYIYPLYGLGELPQAFARLSAIYGGTYVLEKPFNGLNFDEDGKVSGIKTDTGDIACKIVIGDPSYFPDRVKQTKKLVRAICFLKAPIPSTGGIDSVQIIIPQRQLNRQYDIYVAMVSSSHNICAKGLYVAYVSTIVETENPEKELEPGLKLLGPILEKFVSVTPVYESESTSDNVFVSESYDPSSHFESVCAKVKSLYESVTGNPLVIQKRETPDAPYF